MRRRLDDLLQPLPVSEITFNNSYNIHLHMPNNRSLGSKIVPGKGWQVFGEPQGYCDGTYNAVCGRETDNECVLYGHHDG